MKDKLSYGYTSDVIIFAIESKNDENIRTLPNKYLSILLVKREKEPFKNKWCLPGGFIEKNETSKEASKRILKKETNLSNIYLTHIDTFDSINRDPRGRIISNGSMALIDKDKLTSSIKENSKWFEITINEEKEIINILLTNNLEKLNIRLKKNYISSEYDYEVLNSDLSFDHGLIINKSLEFLKNKVKNTDIIFNLMPTEFTIGELKQVYELLLNKKLVNSAFRRAITPKLTPTGKIIKTGGFRPTELYKYKNKKYN